MIAAGFQKSLGSGGDLGRWGRKKTGSGRLKRLANFLSLGIEGTSSPDSHFLYISMATLALLAAFSGAIAILSLAHRRTYPLIGALTDTVAAMLFYLLY